ncbi:hypothetical protein EVAR_32674_1 [Eumeta japonica]|uniref:Uncharacterized protein n=1 Tax=Eumeta variegata TaxID=151549 RepID=A0A4C1VQG3_EUMVA|nr:hypothetical protein EVAR_32674_1 [Eumeta japonica]
MVGLENRGLWDRCQGLLTFAWISSGPFLHKLLPVAEHHTLLVPRRRAGAIVKTFPFYETPSIFSEPVYEKCGRARTGLIGSSGETTEQI